MGTLSTYVAPVPAEFAFIHRRRAIWILPLALVSFFFLQSPVSAIPISALVATNGSIQQGDKLFKNFRFGPFFPIGDVSPQQNGAIDVQGITASGENGLRFSGPFTANFPGDGASLALATYHVGYDVFVTDPSFKATDFSQSFTVTSSGVNSAHVSATVKNCTAIVCTGPGQFELFGVDTGFTGSPPSSPTLSGNFDFPFGTNFLSVDLDIFICSLCSIFNTPNPASVAFPFFDEIYSQAVPEPSALVILGAGLLAFGSIRRRRKAS
jgi:hypothetical protein